MRDGPPEDGREPGRRREILRSGLRRWERGIDSERVASGFFSVDQAQIAAVAGFGVATLVLAISLAVIVRRGRGFRALAERGVDGEATVLRKWVRSPESPAPVYLVRYVRRGEDGSAARRTCEVPEEVYRAVEAGGSLEICYLPDRPRTTAPRFLVQEARRAGSGTTGGGAG